LHIFFTTGRCLLGACLLGGIIAIAQAADTSASAKAVRQLEGWLRQPREKRPALAQAAFARTPLTRADAQRAQTLLWEDHAAWIRATRAAEMAAKVLELDGLKMRFEMVSFGPTNPPPPGGRSLFIAMHGGGGAPPAVNDSQWKNQIRLAQAYAPKEGIYLAPRAPTDTWDLWHQAHMDRFLARLIENLIILGPVNPDRIYLMGYSAGGDGVYQVAPRMADRFAAAAMMAGHPNEASPLGLRNLPFILQVGALDVAYKRNQVAEDWGRKLAALHQADPEGYVHKVELHAGKGHWMDLADRQAIPWMEQFHRQPWPQRVVWRQDDVTHEQFYWLALPAGTARVNQEVHAQRQENIIDILQVKDMDRLLIRLNDAMLNLDAPVTVQQRSRRLFHGVVPRTLATLAQTLQERGDPRLVFSAEITVALPTAD
jgi:poly(3-hydroxybutyrate) depolymerase